MASDSAHTFETAIKTLKDAINPADAVAFRSTSMEDVWKAAEEIQESQRKRKSLRNMRRIEPFLKALEKYSKCIEVLCNGTPYLPWIWAPIKLALQLAEEYTNVFDKLIDAYSQIGQAMSRFDRLEAAFGNDPNFKAVLGMIYEDILEFHRRAYKFFRRRCESRFADISTI
jgi:tetratricopeptide (TPR) repeat protein